MKPLVVKRTHGLGNVLLLLPVLERLRDEGRQVTLVTRPEWTGVVRALTTGIEVREDTSSQPVDLDAMTLKLRPTEHRTYELARLLGVEGHIECRAYDVPPQWGQPFSHLAGATVFAPEAGHTAREWPVEHTGSLCDRLVGTPLVLTGLDPHTPLVCDVDLRGRLSLEQMLGLLSVAGRLVTMDSGALHMATSIGLPVMAVFGGVDPLRRVRRSQRVMALQSGRGCAPCNKNETCEGAYHCLQDISPVDVLQALERLDRTRGLEVLEIQEAR